MVVVSTKKHTYQFRNETHVKKYSNGDDIEAEINFGDDPDLCAKFLEGKEKMVLSLEDSNDNEGGISPLFMVFKPMAGEFISIFCTSYICKYSANVGRKCPKVTEYAPGPEDWRITLKAFGDKVLAFCGDSQVKPNADRDFSADELEEAMGKDVTPCIDFKGEGLRLREAFMKFRFSLF